MPSDTPQVMDAAEKLAQMVAEHPLVDRFRQAQQAVANDPETSRLTAEFDRQLQKLVQQQQSGLPVTDAQQQQLESLQSKIVSHIKIKALNLAQVDYVDLRRKIGQAIDRAVAGPNAPGTNPAAAPQRTPGNLM